MVVWVLDWLFRSWFWSGGFLVLLGMVTFGLGLVDCVLGFGVWLALDFGSLVYALSCFGYVDWVVWFAWNWCGFTCLCVWFWILLDWLFYLYVWYGLSVWFLWFWICCVVLCFDLVVSCCGVVCCLTVVGFCFIFGWFKLCWWACWWLDLFVFCLLYLLIWWLCCLLSVGLFVGFDWFWFCSLIIGVALVGLGVLLDDFID